MKHREVHILLTLAAVIISIVSIAMTKKVAKDVLERQLLLETRRSVISNASKANVIALVDITGEQVDRELIKEALTYHTENIFYYFSIRDSLSEFSITSLDSHLTKTHKMFEKLLNESDTDFVEFDKSKGELYEFSIMLIKEIEKLERKYLVLFGKKSPTFYIKRGHSQSIPIEEVCLARS